MKRCVAALSALAVLGTSCSAGTSRGGDPTTPVTTQQSTAPRPVAHIGDTLNLMRVGEQQIAVTLDQVINPATVPNDWGAADKTYVATKLTLTNIGTTTIVGNSNSNVTVVGSDNQDYHADFATVTECQDFQYGWFLLAAGASKTGCVTFALPHGVTPVKVKYTPSSGISRDVGEWFAP